MADVFISYKSERRAAAQHLARVLELHGFSVWFDYGLYSGRDFGRQIERELRAAQAVIVLWCKLSVDSEWVFAEAYKAKEMEKLLTTQIEAANIPVPFNIADTIDLAKWDGAPRSHALDRLLAEITRLVGRDPMPQFNGLKTYDEQWRGLGALAMAKLPLTAKVAETEISPGAALLDALGEEAQLLEQKAAQAAEARKNAEDQRRALEARIAEAKAAAQAEADQRRAAEAEALALQEELQRPVIAPPPPPAPPPRLLPPSAAPRVDEQPGFLRRYAPWAAGAAALALLGVIVINNSGSRPERPPIDQPAIDPADAAAFANAKAVDSPQSYQAYLDAYPAGAHAMEASRRREELIAADAAARAQADDDAFARAARANTIAAFEAYLDVYPEGAHAAEAQEKLTALRQAEQDAANARTAEEAQARAKAEDDAFAGAQRANSIAGFEAYLAQYPNGRHVAAARRAIREINAANAAADAAAKAKADDDAFAIAQAANTIAAFQAYLNRYPQGRNVAAARAAIGRLQAPPPAPPPATTASFLDARSTPVTTRAPLIAVDPARLPDFALFRECDVCPEMVVMPAGSFSMGSPNGEAGRDPDEGPQQNITLRRFAIARFETIWAEWEACVAARACAQGPVDKAGGDNGWGRNRRPVIEVDWKDAGAYAAYIARAAGKGGYRRPTEAEWEYAARGGTTTRYSFGDSEGQLDAHAWYFANSGRKTQPVGGKAANPFGLYDMHGNVWEWVEDCWRENLIGQPANGAAYTTQGCTVSSYRVFRGGSWSSFPQALRSANRYWDSPANRFYNLGFRLARTL